jgi:hypothetical protein
MQLLEMHNMTTLPHNYFILFLYIFPEKQMTISQFQLTESCKNRKLEQRPMPA